MDRFMKVNKQISNVLVIACGLGVLFGLQSIIFGRNMNT